MVWGRKNKCKIARILKDRMSRIQTPEEFQEFLDLTGIGRCWCIGSLMSDLYGLRHKPVWQDYEGSPISLDDEVVINYNAIRVKKILSWFPEHGDYWVGVGFRMPKAVAEKIMILGFV